jgi:hypothetical protein
MDILKHKTVQDVFELRPHDDDCENVEDSSYLPTNRLIGVELEYEGVKSMPESRELAGWSATSDGSLRDGGIEFRFSSPAGGLEAAKRIRRIKRLQASGKWKTSRRTSMHVHVDCMDLTIGQVFNVLSVYALLEPVLFNFVDKARVISPYCVPFFRSDSGEVGKLYNFHKGMEQYNSTSLYNSVVRSVFTSGVKYSCVNIGSLSYFGSIEFRHAEIMPTLKTFKWIAMLLRIVQAGANMKSPSEAIDSFDSLGAERFSELIIGHKPDSFDLLGHTSYSSFCDYVDLIGVAERVGGVIHQMLIVPPDDRWLSKPAVVPRNPRRLTPPRRIRR